MTMFAEQSEIGDESYTLDLDFMFYVNFKLNIKLSPVVNKISQLTHSWLHNQNRKSQTINHTHKNTQSVRGEKKTQNPGRKLFGYYSTK